MFTEHLLYFHLWQTSYNNNNLIREHSSQERELVACGVIADYSLGHVFTHDNDLIMVNCHILILQQHNTSLTHIVFYELSCRRIYNLS